MESNTKPCGKNAQSQRKRKTKDTAIEEFEKSALSNTAKNTAQSASDDNLLQTNSTTKKIKRRYAPQAEEHELNGYNKKKLLSYLKNNGCNTHFFEKEVSCFKVRRDTVFDFFNKHAEQAQLHVHEECGSLSFENIDSWLRLFKSWDLPDKSYYEQAIVVNAIANNEEQPKPQELGGIDLKSIYKFVGNALLGLPQPGLDQKSAEFLAREFEFLVDDANSDSGDMETRRIKSLLLQNTSEHVALRERKLSLDPLWLDDSIA